MESPQAFMTRLLRMWTDTDPASRRDALERLFVADARFNDIDGEFVGYEGLERFSDSLRSRFPGARFTLIDAASIGNAIRATWTFGPDGHPDAVTGMDFVVLDEDKITQLFAFVEQPDE